MCLEDQKTIHLVGELSVLLEMIVRVVAVVAVVLYAVLQCALLTIPRLLLWPSLRMLLYLGYRLYIPNP